MDLKRVNAEEAKKLVDDEGYVVVDVRSMPEFAEEHADGSVNIPFLHRTPQGMIPNEDFGRIVEFKFPDTNAKIVTTCAMGGRSVRAAQQLLNMGYTNVVDLRGGFSSEKDESGNIVHAGWKDSGYATETGEPEGRSYKSINNAANQARQEAAGDSGEAPAPAAPALSGANRFASATRKVNCARLGKELPGLKRRPYPGDLGQRIFDTISAEAWNAWVEHSKMIINEYRINSADPKAIKLLMEQCEAFLFGEGVSQPEGYVPNS